MNKISERYSMIKGKNKMVIDAINLVQYKGVPVSAVNIMQHKYIKRIA